MKQKNFSITARIKSFRYAVAGIVTLLKNEHNARIHLFVTGCTIIAGWILEISTQEWIFILLCIGFVFSTEAINSAIEYLADFISPAYNPKIKQAKDVAAAAVLFAAITAVITGLIIFIPKIANLIQ